MTDDRRTAKSTGSKPPGSPSPPLDPFAVWREWVTQSEHHLNRMFNDMMGTEEFARASGSWVEAMTMFQQAVNENAQRYFQMAGVPTRTDVSELAERLAALEERLLRIERLLAAAVGRRDVRDQVARPARTRRPPSARGAAPAEPPRETPVVARLVDAVADAAPAGTAAASDAALDTASEDAARDAGPAMSGAASGRTGADTT